MAEHFVLLLQNLRVKISDIHIRYEDPITNPTRPFAFGVCLTELSLQPSQDAAEAGLQYMYKVTIGN